MAKRTAKPTSDMTVMSSPITAPGSPRRYRARVRMYRHGLGDCFLLTIPRSGKRRAAQILIDCGALARDKMFMQSVVSHIARSVRGKSRGKAVLDVVVGTHEHKDHLSGFNQARQIFNDEFDFKSVWLAWSENLSQAEVRKIKDARKRVKAGLTALATSSRFVADDSRLQGLAELASFTSDDDSVEQRTVENALDYLKARGTDAGDLRYLEPGGEPTTISGVPGVKVYVLGPPRDPVLIKTSAVTERMKRDDIVYHLGAVTGATLEALAGAADPSTAAGQGRSHPFAPEHRRPLPSEPGVGSPQSWSAYVSADQAWRRIDNDWLGAFEQLALDLDNDTNNTSLVLAFEFGNQGDVLLFVADAQIGSWLSWPSVSFSGGPGTAKAKDLLERTVFYKVGHHCSHNATARSQGLEWMTHDDLVAFIPLDQATAKSQGKKGWAMPAPALFKALKARTRDRTVISDVEEALPAGASAAGVVATKDYVDFFLK